jgi:hypothetical protein
MEGDTIVVFIPQNVSHSSARAAIARGAMTLNLAPKLSTQMVLGDRLKFRVGTYPFSQLIAWASDGTGGIARLPGVTGIDVNEGTNRISVIVADMSAAQGVLTAATAAGIPQAAISIDTQGPVVSLASIRDRIRPAGGGMQIAKGYQSYCTMGFNILRGDDAYGFYTAGHCSPGSLGGGSTGGLLYQNEGTTNDRIATVAVNPQWNKTVADCGGITLCTQVDALLALYDTTSHWSSRVAIMTGLATYGGGNLSIWTRDGWWTSINLGGASYWQGIDVDKVGRTTGWTRGDLDRTCVHITVNPGQSNQYKVLCADEVVGAYAGQGDSGSPVFIGHDTTNTEVDALGILFAGDLSGGYDTDSEGNKYCNTGACKYYYSRMSRLSLFLPYAY